MQQSWPTWKSLSRGPETPADFDMAIRLGHTALAVDPQADAIELELLKAYKASGRQAAAAEQYTHYVDSDAH